MRQSQRSSRRRPRWTWDGATASVMIRPVVWPSGNSLVSLAAVLAVSGLVLSCAAVWLMARALLRPPRMTDGKAAWVLKRLSPGDLGLGFEEISFPVRDERTGTPLRINGWWIPAAGPGSERCVVLLHGYADAKVGAIAWAPPWHELGYHILALDLRAHGESGGVESTAGFFERHDVAQVIGRLRAERPAETRRLVLFGVSLGAAVAAATAALPEERRAADGAANGAAGGGANGAAGVDAVVLESPFADFRTAAMTHMDAMGVPGGVFQRAALRLAERMSGAQFDAVRPASLVRTLRCSVLVIAPGNDPFCPAGEAMAMETAVSARPAGAGVGRVWRVEGVGHLMAAYEQPEAYRQNLKAFLDDALGSFPPPLSAAAVRAEPPGVTS